MALTAYAPPLRLTVALMLAIAYMRYARRYSEDAYTHEAWFSAWFRYDTSATARGVLAHLAATKPTVVSLRVGGQYRVVRTRNCVFVIAVGSDPPRIVARVSRPTALAPSELRAEFDHGEIGGEMLVRLHALFTAGTADLPAFDARFVAWLPVCLPRLAVLHARAAATSEGCRVRDHDDDDARVHASWAENVVCVRLHYEHAMLAIMQRLCDALRVDTLRVLLPCVFAGCTSAVSNVVGARQLHFRRDMTAEWVHIELERQQWTSKALAAGNAMRLLPMSDGVRGAFDVILSVAYVRDAASLPVAYRVRCETRASRARVYAAAICAPCALGVRYVTSVDTWAKKFDATRVRLPLAAEFDVATAPKSEQAFERGAAASPARLCRTPPPTSSDKRA